MSGEAENTTTSEAVSKKNKYRKDKPWDNDPTIDKWKVDEFKPEDNPNGGPVLESSFAVLFPEYREKYIREIFPLLKRDMKKYHIKAEMNLAEGSLTVTTTDKMWDPYSIIKARDLIKLIARSVPYQQAVKIMQDDMFCDIIKIGGIVRNKERFVKRRQRLIGPKGMTLKALEMLTKCYILVQGSTVACMGYFKDLKQVRRIILDTMHNIHPIYNIKELMIKRELASNPELKNENWDRFLPKFKKQNAKRKKLKIKKKEFSPFPPEQQLRKEDYEMFSGEYFLTPQQKENLKNKEKAKKREIKKKEKEEEQEKLFTAPEEPAKVEKPVFEEKKPDLDELKKKFIKRRKK
ncbi:unnamed protein product [Moneuplotes crassus]|uniref:KRR1 small subunit processome component n=1 Tax=Euplotes crassus TaxID=5936 RepID=A0AAD1UC02_EUPCR|nr:unnamed protein product [Moneuplotes crassus]